MRAFAGLKYAWRIFSPALNQGKHAKKTAPEMNSEAVLIASGFALIARVPEDHVTTFLAFDGGKVCVDLARSNLWICEGDRDIFAA